MFTADNSKTQVIPEQNGTSFRLSDLHKILKGRYNGPCRTGDAERYLMAALPELMRRARSWRYAVTWAQTWTPVLVAERGEDFIRASWMKVAARKCRHLTTDALARLLTVSDDEPRRLNLRCIPAMSRNAEERAVDRKRAKAETEARRRAANPKHTPRSKSAAATEPWKGAGISRRTWYSQRAAERFAASAVTVDATPLHCFVDTVSVAPSCTVSWTPDPLPPLSSGHREMDRAVAANDNPTSEAPPLTETGYRGRYLTLTAEQVNHVVTNYPKLAAGIRTHLDGIDKLMRMTPQDYKKRVFRNLINDCDRRVGRALRKAA